MSDNVEAQGDHLPECPASGTGGDIFNLCICERLRQCEARVREDEQVAAALEIAHKTSEHYAYGRADALTQMLDAGSVMGQEFYAKGLDAAMEAVAALDAYYAIEECQGSPLVKGDPNDPDPWQQGHLIQRDDTLAAIDALRGE